MTSGAYIDCMRNRDLNSNNHPAPAELYALERAARSARAAELARLLKASLASVKGLLASRNVTKGLRHA